MNKNWLLKISALNRLTKQFIAGTMSVSLIAQPLFAQAQVTADPNAGAANRPSIGAAPNGVPMVDIATPNGQGLSHNKYQDFNVGTPGLILNNHNGEVGNSQLGGVTPGNPNLRQTGSANVILNEVTSGNRSSLEGATEIYGQKADVVIANPNGITCNGCGFINTPRATLTTGVPLIGLDGTLSGFDVRGGDVQFGPKGANLASGAGSVDIFDIVSRTVTFEGPVAGRDVGVTAGAGKFDYATREMKELYDIAGKPEYAIDGSALGALQADRIKVVATEKGVGVRMRNDMAANAGQLTLSADGKITLNNVSGRDGVKMTSRSKTVAAKKVTSKKNVEIKANDGITIETIGADGDLMVDSGAGLLSIEGDAIAGGKLGFKSGGAIKTGQVASGSDMDMTAANGIDVLVAVADGQARLQSKSGNISATNGIKAGGGDLNITADKGSISAATLISFNNMTLNAGQELNVAGNITASNNVKAQSGGQLTVNTVLAGQNADIEAYGNVVLSMMANGLDVAATNASGELHFTRKGDVSIASAAGNITTGNVYSTNAVDIVAKKNVHIGNTLAAVSNVSILSGSVTGERLITGQNLLHGQSNDSLDKAARTKIITQSGDLQINQILGGGEIGLTSYNGSVISKQIQSLSNIDVLAHKGSITAERFYADGKTTFNAAGTIIVTGQSYSGGDLRFNAQSTKLAQAIVAGDATIASDTVSALKLVTYGGLNISGRNVDVQTSLAAHDIVINAASFSANTIISGLNMSATDETGYIVLDSTGKTTINASDKINVGQVISADTLTLNAINDINYVSLGSNKDISLESTSGTLSLQNSLIAGGNISLKANILDLSNNRTNIKTGKTLSLDGETVDVSNSSLTFGGLILNARSGLNAQNARLAAIKKNGGNGDITLTVPSLFTSQNTNILSDNDLSVFTSSIENYGQLASGNNLLIKATNGITNRNTGLIFAGNNGSLFTNGAILNELGALIAQHDLSLANYNNDGKNTSLTNKAGLIQAINNLSIKTQYLLNEADVEPIITSSHTTSDTISFNKPKNYDLLRKYDQDVDFDKIQKYVINPYPLPYLDPEFSTALGHDTSNGWWGIIETSSNDTARVVEQVSREETYSTLQIDGVTYKADNWLLGYTRRNGKIEFWYLNPVAGMRKDETVQKLNVDTIRSGRIQANANLDINSDVIDNKYSSIEAGNNATIAAQTINNVGVAAYRNSSVSCLSKSQCLAYDAEGKRLWAKDVSAGSTIATDMVATKSFAAVIKAGGKLDLSAPTINNTVAENTIASYANYEATGSSGRPLDALKGMNAGDALFKPSIDLGLFEREHTNVNLSAAIERGDIAAPKPNSGGFGGTLPNQYFIYETRAAFLDVGKFYGSSYYLGRVGYTPDKQILFMGDAYFENQLIDKQMRDLVGQGLGKGSFIPGNDAIDQMKSLLDAGADYSAQNGLAFGEPLSPEQVAHLDQSIVVYVKQSINGAEVYAPVLYVAAKDKANVVSSGSMIQGDSVNITTDNITNSGLIASNSNLKLQATNILSNGGGFAAKGDLVLASTGSITFNAATTNLNGQAVIVPTKAIDAGGTAIISAQKDLDLNGVGVRAQGSLGLSGENVNIGTATATTANGSQNVTGSTIEAGKDLQVKAEQNITVTGSDVHAGDRLAMSAEHGDLTIQSAQANRSEQYRTTTTQQKSQISSGGSMSLSADKNIVIAGSDVDSGGSLGMKAGETVAIVATQDTSHEQIRRRTSDTLTQQSSNVSAASNMGIQAGEDILIGASNLTAGGNVALEAQGDITVTAMADKKEDHVNGGRFKMNSSETTNVGSSITAGGNVTAIAGQDGEDHNLNIIGSSIDAGGKVGLKTTGDINILAVEDTYHRDVKQKSGGGGLFGKTKTSTSNEDSTTMVGSSISGGDGVNIQSGGNTTVSASDIMAGTAEKTADLNISAGGDLIVASGTDVESASSSNKKKGFLSSSAKSKDTYDETNVASNLGATGNVNLYAEGHAVISGSNVVAGEDINIEGSSVSVIGAQENHHSETTKKKTGFGVGSGEGFYSIYGSEGKTNIADRTDNVGSNLVSGGDTNLTARDTDVNVIGSQIVAGNDINLDAARDVNILPGHESQSESEEKTRSGFGIQLQHTNSSASIGIGVASAKDEKSEDHSINAKSGLNAGNDVNINAGRDANLVAADVSAGRDVNIYAENDINLLSANDVSNYDEMHERLFAGVTVQVGSNVLAAAQDISDAAARAGKGGTDMEGLSNIAIAGANIYGAEEKLRAGYNEANNLIGHASNGTLLTRPTADGKPIFGPDGKPLKSAGENALNGNLINGSITVGFTHSQSESSTTTSTPVVTTIDAGRSANLEAANGSINGVGVQINAGSDNFWNLIGDDKAGDINLTAAKDVNLVSAVGSQTSDSKSTSIGAQIGVDLSMTPTGNAYLDKGTSNSDGTYNVNAHVTGTGDLTVNAGGDWNLKGAVASANSVTADIAGNLNIESQVDTQNVGIDHKTISGGFGGGGASFDYTSQTANGESSTVSEQSGIHAGKGGFDLKVDGNTGLIAGVITSTAPEDKNKLETGTLSWSDIETGSEWETKTSGFGGTIGTGASGAAGSGPLIKPTLKDGDKDSGSAKSAISPGQITITNPEGQNQDLAALNRDTTNTNDEIKALPDLQAKLNEQLKTQQEWTQAAANMATAVKDAADFMRDKVAQDKKQKELWDEGGAARAALHAIAGGLLGGVNGVEGAIKSAIAAGVSTLIAPYINDIVKEAVAQSGLTGEDAKRMSDTLTSSIVLGLLASAGGSDAAAYASNEIKYNYLTAEQRKEVERLLLCQLNKAECSPEELQNMKALLEEFKRISLEQSKELDRICNQGPSEACNRLLKEAQEFQGWLFAIPGTPTYPLDLTHSYSTIEATGILGIGDLTYDNILLDVYGRGLSGEEASREIVATIVRHNANLKIVNGTLMTVSGLALCPVSSGAGCMVAIAVVSGFGANRIEQGVHERITDKEQLSIIEAGMVKVGVSEATAKNIVSKLETGAVIATSVYGGYTIIREVGANGKVLAIAKVDDEAARYLANSKPSKTPTELVQEQAGKASGNKITNSIKTQVSVDNKLDKYLLDKSHPLGKSKAEWFDKALGFDKSNAGELSKQIVFDSNKAVQTGVTEYGTKYNQVINITGANGKKIDVTFAWIKNNDGVVRLVTGIPPKK